MNTDCYLLLGIDPAASESAIRRAYRAKAKEVHPDVNKSPEAAAQFRLLTDAVELLCSPTRRRAHDLQFGYYKKAKKKGEQTLYTIKEEAAEKAKSMISEWEQSMAAQQAAADKRNADIQKQYRKRRRVTLLLAILLCWLIAAAIYFFA